jgi:hypothetical protein
MTEHGMGGGEGGRSATGQKSDYKYFKEAIITHRLDNNNNNVYRKLRIISSIFYYYYFLSFLLSCASLNILSIYPASIMAIIEGTFIHFSKELLNKINSPGA